MDKGMSLKKELACGCAKAKREASGNMFRDGAGRFKCGGAVKAKPKLTPKRGKK